MVDVLWKVTTVDTLPAAPRKWPWDTDSWLDRQRLTVGVEDVEEVAEDVAEDVAELDVELPVVELLGVVPLLPLVTGDALLELDDAPQAATSTPAPTTTSNQRSWRALRPRAAPRPVASVTVPGFGASCAGGMDSIVVRGTPDLLGTCRATWWRPH